MTSSRTSPLPLLALLAYAFFTQHGAVQAMRVAEIFDDELSERPSEGASYSTDAAKTERTRGNTAYENATTGRQYRDETWPAVAAAIKGFWGTPAPTRPAPKGIILDTDCGYDDFMAAGVLAKNVPLVKLVTTVHGMNDPASGACWMKKMFEKVGRKGGPWDETGAYTLPKFVVGAKVSQSKHIKLWNTLEELDCGTPAPTPAPEGEQPKTAAPTTNTTETPQCWGKDYKSNLAKFLKENLEEAGTCYDEGDAVEEMVKLLQSSEDVSVDIVAIGPLTNIAKLVRENDQLVKQKVGRLFIMGGTLHKKGNVGGAKAELNFFADPVAAQDVFSSHNLSGKLYVYGLDVCNRVAAGIAKTDEWDMSVQEASTGVMSLSQKANADASDNGRSDTFTFDPLAAYAAIEDGKGFDYEKVAVEIGELGDVKIVKKPDDWPGESLPIVNFAWRCNVREQYVHKLVGWCRAKEITKESSI